MLGMMRQLGAIPMLNAAPNASTAKT